MTEPFVVKFDSLEIPEELSDFDPGEFENTALEWADGLVGRKEKVAMSVSGGVDSTSAAYLFKAFGNRLYLYFINDGLRRTIRSREEADIAADIFGDFPNFEVIEVGDLFLPWFEREDDNRFSRDIFRGLYGIVSNGYIHRVSADWIVDGTNKADRRMFKRQRQHNVKLPYMVNKLEPLASLYKPQVRKLAMHLGVPREFAMKIPCPGPAHLLNIVGKFNRAKLEICKPGTDIWEQMVDEYCEGLWGEPYKYDEKTGVRTPFEYFVTCLDPEMLLNDEVSSIASDFLGRSMKCYEMETEAMWIKPIDEEQDGELYAPIIWVEGPEIDYSSMVELGKTIFHKAKFPRVVYEVFDSGRHGHPVVLKAVESEDVMTAWPMDIKYDYLRKAGKIICDETGASKTGYAISEKPPTSIRSF